MLWKMNLTVQITQSDIFPKIRDVKLKIKENLMKSLRAEQILPEAGANKSKASQKKNLFFFCYEIDFPRFFLIFFSLKIFLNVCKNKYVRGALTSLNPFLGTSPPSLPVWLFRLQTSRIFNFSLLIKSWCFS